MILAIDIGNTNIVLGCMEHDRILVEARMATDLLKTSDQYCVELKNLLNLYEVDLQAIEGVIISSVVPPVLNSCKTAVRKLTGKTPMIVGPGIKTGLNIQMENPAQIGSDLIVAAVAALSRFKPPLIIVDMGTATTMTAIDKNGTYVGGCISPGPKLSAESLSTRTAQLPAISLESPKKAIGKNTVDAMRSGVMLGSGWLLLDGVLTVIMSLFLLFNQWFTMLSLPFLFTLWLLFSGVSQCVSSFDLRALGVRAWGWILAVGILLTLAGFICLMDPWVSVAAMGMTVGIVFLLEGVSSIVYACISRTKDI